MACFAPQILQGLSRAASDQQIGFRALQTGIHGYSQPVGAAVGSSEPPLRLAPSESTSGAIYAYGRSLYLALTQYRHRPEPATTINMAIRSIPDSTGLANRTVMYRPEFARQGDSYRPTHSASPMPVIDYVLLGSLPATSGSPASVQATPAPAGPQLNSPVKTEPAQKDFEIEALRKELQEIKRQLAEQKDERIRSQPGDPVTPK